MKYLREKHREIIIADDHTLMKWWGTNKRYYVDLGYSFTKIGDFFKCRVSDLPKSSPCNVSIECPICHKTRKMKYSNLIRYGHTICNGCSRIIDMTGERYGRWTVIDLDYGRGSIYSAYWMCVCECGTTSSVSRAALVKGESKSCGCYQVDTMTGKSNPSWKQPVSNICEWCGNEYKLKPNEAKKRRFCSPKCFHKWIAKEFSGENSNNWRGGLVSVLCKQCGKKYKVPNCRKRTTSFCSNKCAGDWSSKNLSGENSHNWNHNIPYEERISRRCLPENYRWVKNVLERDDYTCQICGRRGGKLEAHHLYDYASYPEKRFDLDNGITMCKTEHREFHSWLGGNMVPCTPADIDRWLFFQE